MVENMCVSGPAASRGASGAGGFLCVGFLENSDYRCFLEIEAGWEGGWEGMREGLLYWLEESEPPKLVKNKRRKKKKEGKKKKKNFLLLCVGAGFIVSLCVIDVRVNMLTRI